MPERIPASRVAEQSHGYTCDWLALHTRLVGLQPHAEIERKARKAGRRKGKLWTIEEMDLIDANTQKMMDEVKWE